MQSHVLVINAIISYTEPFSASDIGLKQTVALLKLLLGELTVLFFPFSLFSFLFYMTLIPDNYADLMPADPDLLVDLGRVAWAAARLHSGVRDSINKHNGSTSMAPFALTLGQAIAGLEKLAKNNGRADQEDWVRDFGRPSSRRRNAVIHAVTFTATDDKQAIRTVDNSPPGRFLAADLRAVTLALIEASMKLPI